MRRFWVGLATVVVAAALVAGLVLGNQDNVTVNLLFLKLPTKLWAALVGAGLFGAAIAALLLAIPLSRLGLESRRRTKRLAELEREIHGLRTQPIDNPVGHVEPGAHH